MKNYIISAFFILISLSGMSQNAIELKENPDNRLLGYKIFEEIGMEYHNDSTFRIIFDWKKVGDLLDGTFGSRVETSLVKTFGKDRITITPTNFVFIGKSISAEEIGNVYLNNSLQIKDVASYVGLYERECLGTYDSTSGLVIMSRNFVGNVLMNEKYLYTPQDHKIKLIGTSEVPKFK